MTPAKKSEAAKPQPQPQATLAPATTAKPEVPTKQMLTLDRLKEAWTKRGVNLSEMKTTQDGKFLLVVVGPQWPTIKLGPTGGIDLPQIKSYAKAFDAAVNGDVLLKKQNERQQKKAPAPAAPAPQKPETPTARKTKQHEQLEKQMA